MSRPTNTWRKVMAQPGHFTLQVLKAFQKNQGLLLSGALAYYILLSVIPLFTFLLLMLSHVVDEAALLATLRRYIGLIVPGDSAAVLEQVRNILEHREVASWVVLCAMLFFSSLAFSVLESALSIIFIHRVRHKPRPLIVSLALPYVYILLLGVGFLVMTAIASLLQSMSDDQLVLAGAWLVAGQAISRPTVSDRRGRPDPRPHLHLPGHAAERTHTSTPCSHWRDRSRVAVGGDPAYPGLVFFHAVSRRRRLRLAGDHDCRAAEPRNRQHYPLAWRAGDRRIRAPSRR